MPETMHPFLAHLEAHMGPIQAGGRLRDGVQAVRFKDRPFRGASSFLTLGLSHHVLRQEEGAGVRIEFLLSCRNEFVASFNSASVLADVCDAVFEAQSPPLRGAVFGPRGRFFDESEMEALYCSPPRST